MSDDDAMRARMDAIRVKQMCLQMEQNGFGCAAGKPR